MANTKITNPELFNLGDSTSATQLPVMTTTQRIAMTGLSVGEMIFNSTTDKVEYWDGTKWYGITYEVAAETPYNNVLYTGSTSPHAITGVGFQPDLIWVKRRTTSTANHYIVDTVRGNGTSTYKNLSSDTTNVEGTTTSSGITNSTIVDGGFTMQGTGARTNASGSTYVAWCFKAGGAAVANTDGNITSQVSANVAGGFSIVSWSGNNTTGGTIGHGLSSTPELTIIKKTSGAAADWQVSLNASVTGVEGYMNFNKTAALYTTYPLYYTSSNSTVLSSNGTSTATRLYNNQSENYIAYCFHSVAGYSKVGSYTGNGSTSTGKTIDLGFQPAFIMIKNITTTGSSSGWFMIDNKRNTSDPWNKYIFANNNAAEGTTTLSLTSVGATSFTVKSSGRAINYNGDNYIYMSFA